MYTIKIEVGEGDWYEGKVLRMVDGLNVSVELVLMDNQTLFFDSRDITTIKITNDEE